MYQPVTEQHETEEHLTISRKHLLVLLILLRDSKAGIT